MTTIQQKAKAARDQARREQLDRNISHARNLAHYASLAWNQLTGDDFPESVWEADLRRDHLPVEVSASIDGLLVTYRKGAGANGYSTDPHFYLTRTTDYETLTFRTLEDLGRLLELNEGKLASAPLVAPAGVAPAEARLARRAPTRSHTVRFDVTFEAEDGEGAAAHLSGYLLALPYVDQVFSHGEVET